MIDNATKKQQVLLINYNNMGMMDIEEMKNLVLTYVIEEYIDDDDVEIAYDTPLISSGYVDSFSMVSLLIFLEKKFKIKIPSNKATPEAFDSVNNIVNMVNQHLE